MSEATVAPAPGITPMQKPRIEPRTKAMRDSIQSLTLGATSRHSDASITVKRDLS